MRKSSRQLLSDFKSSLKSNFTFYLMQSISHVPKDHQFMFLNRAELHKHLTSLKGRETRHESFLNHYRGMNVVCDRDGIQLTDDELEFFKKTLKPGTDIPISELLQAENRMFEKNAEQFSGNKEDLNYKLRHNRPPFDFYPQWGGNLTIKEKEIK